MVNRNVTFRRAAVDTEARQAETESGGTNPRLWWGYPQTWLLLKGAFALPDNPKWQGAVASRKAWTVTAKISVETHIVEDSSIGGTSCSLK